MCSCEEPLYQLNQPSITPLLSLFVLLIPTVTCHCIFSGCGCRAGVREQCPVLWDVVLPVAIFQFPSSFLWLSQYLCNPRVMTANQARELSHGACIPVEMSQGWDG